MSAEVAGDETGAVEPTGDSHSTRFLLSSVALAVAAVIAVVLVRPLFNDDDGPVKRFGSRVVTERVDSALIGRELPVKVVVPRRAPGEKRKLVVFLHGRGSNERSYLYEEMFKALAREDGNAPIFAFPRGGSSSYWHDRADGEWGSYVLDEVIPTLRDRFRVSKRLVAIGGISMGGYGAFHLAAREPQKFCAVGGHSAAVWRDPADSAEGAFDDAADFAANDVIEQVGSPAAALEGKPTWVDVGKDDPFAPEDAALARALTSGGSEVEYRVFEGEHDSAYWKSHWRAYVRFYTKQLNACE